MLTGQQQQKIRKRVSYLRKKTSILILILKLFIRSRWKWRRERWGWEWYEVNSFFSSFFHFPRISAEYDPEKIYDFPGFNQPVPDSYIDVSELKGGEREERDWVILNN